MAMLGGWFAQWNQYPQVHNQGEPSSQKTSSIVQLGEGWVTIGILCPRHATYEYLSRHVEGVSLVPNKPMTTPYDM